MNMMRKKGKLPAIVPGLYMRGLLSPMQNMGCVLHEDWGFVGLVRKSCLMESQVHDFHENEFSLRFFPFGDTMAVGAVFKMNENSSYCFPIVLKFYHSASAPNNGGSKAASILRPGCRMSLVLLATHARVDAVRHTELDEDTATVWRTVVAR